jgi:DNA-directed RNA polymerase specialized sigma24 family protein
VTDTPPPVDPAAAPPRPTGSIEDGLRRGDDLAVLDALMTRYGDAVLHHCEAALADLGDPTLGTEARHDTFVEAFRSLNPIEALPDPQAFLLGIADAQCALIRQAEKARRLPRESLDVTGFAQDWQAVVRWEIEVILQEPPEGPDKANARRGRRRSGPSIWPAVVLGAISLVLLLIMWRSS